MKKIDFIINNFQATSFINDIKKGHDQWCVEEVAKNYKDYNDIASKLSYLKFFKGDLNKIPFEKKIKKQINNFINANKEINLINIEKNFFEKDIYNLPNLDGRRDYGGTEDFDLNDLIGNYVYQGILFQKVKEFNLIYIGSISFKNKEALINDNCYSIICFYSKTDRKYHLLVLFLESDGNDSFQYLRSFKKKPSIDEIKTFIKKTSIPSFYDFWKESSSISIEEVVNKIKLDRYWIKQLRKGLNNTYKEKPIYNNEKLFYKIFQSDEEIDYNFVIDDPENYLHNRNPAPYLNTYLKRNPFKKMNSFKFYNFIMSDNFNYKNDINFLKSIEYSFCKDLKGLLQKIPKKKLSDKSLSSEIKTIKLFQTNDINLLIKIFKANSDQLCDLVSKYLPKKWFNNKSLVIQMVKLDPDVISLIGDKLKNDENFMKKILAS